MIRINDVSVANINTALIQLEKDIDEIKSIKSEIKEIKKDLNKLIDKVSNLKKGE